MKPLAELEQDRVLLKEFYREGVAHAIETATVRGNIERRLIDELCARIGMQFGTDAAGWPLRDGPEGA